MTKALKLERYLILVMDNGQLRRTKLGPFSTAVEAETSAQANFAPGVLWMVARDARTPKERAEMEGNIR